MPLVSLNGFEMYYEVRGDGEPLLLLHGGWVSATIGATSLPLILTAIVS